MTRDTAKKGHFIVDQEGLEKAEKILKLFLAFSSRKKVLKMAKEMGISGPKGKELTLRVIDTIIENAKWRYRGKWPIGKSLANKGELKIVDLPHGPLIDVKLLDEVIAKREDVSFSKKKSGVEDYIYLLSHILFHENGTNFSGQCAKNRQYRYYYNRESSLRVRCDELHKLVIERLENYLNQNQYFSDLLEKAILNRFDDLPKLEEKILFLKKEIKALDQREKELGKQVGTSALSDELIKWLDKQIPEINLKRKRVECEIDDLVKTKDEILKRFDVVKIRSSLKAFKGSFYQLTGTEQRDLIEKLIKRITIYKNNRLEIIFYGEPRVSQRRTISTEWKENGGSDGHHPNFSLPSAIL